MYEKKKKIRKTPKFDIPKGVSNHHKIRLRGEGHKLPGMEAGDVVIVCRITKDRTFERRGADLAMKKQITLKEALCGFEFKIKHVSGSTLKIKSKENEIVSPDQIKRVDGWGLPQRGGFGTKGHLYIKFDILFPVPKSVSDDQKKGLSRALATLKYPEEKDREITLGIGVRVKLVRLTNQKYVGRKGRVIAESPSGGRWPIQLDDGKKVAVPENCIDIVKEKSEKVSKTSEEDDYRDSEVVSLKPVKGEPKVTPASVAGQYDEDEDEEGDGVQCKQM